MTLSITNNQLRISKHNIKVSSDILGVVTSILCLVHCLATPLLFIAWTCSANCCEDSPTWWRALDYFFVIISFMAVYRSNKTSKNPWIVTSMWISWTALVLVTLNERFNWMAPPRFWIYFPALFLISLHLYNQKFCQCGETCIHEIE